jgi:hypothetical protein
MRPRFASLKTLRLDDFHMDKTAHVWWPGMNSLFLYGPPVAEKAPPAASSPPIWSCLF